MEIIDSILASPIEDPNKVSLDEIISQVPTLDYDQPLLYHLYMTYNHNLLTDEEREKLRATLNHLKHNMSVINQRNVSYMDRDKDLK